MHVLHVADWHLSPIINVISLLHSYLHCIWCQTVNILVCYHHYLHHLSIDDICIFTALL